jgi:transcriptional regulator with XRE-family HTH domain
MPRGVPRLRTEDSRMNLAGMRVKESRERMGWSQDTLCARIARVTEGVWNPQWRDIWRIEGGTRKISDLELLALAKALQCSAPWLLQLDESR